MSLPGNSPVLIMSWCRLVRSWPQHYLHLSAQARTARPAVTASLQPTSQRATAASVAAASSTPAHLPPPPPPLPPPPPPSTTRNPIPLIPPRANLTAPTAPRKPGRGRRSRDQTLHLHLTFDNEWKIYSFGSPTTRLADSWCARGNISKSHQQRAVNFTPSHSVMSCLVQPK